jgi:hypothetical protein
MNMAQKEITSSLAAVDEFGQPQNFGWARSTLFTYNPLLLNAPRRQVSESDRYLLISPSHLIILEILDDGYFGYVGMSVVSLRDKKRSSQYYTIPFPMGSFALPGDSDAHPVKIQTKKYLLNFAPMEAGVRIIKVDIPKFGHHRSLRGELVLTPPKGADSLVTNMRWRENHTAFRLARRSPWYIAEGIIQFGSQELIFGKGNSWGIFEWGRGLRPSQDMRYWAAGCGQSGGHQVGFSFGYDSADSEPGTANAFFLDGKIHKLDQVTFHVTPSNWLQPWRFTSNDNRLEMIFAPHQERSETLRMFFHYLRRRQICGFFSGKVVLDDGAEFEFQNITGFAERRKSRY